MNLKKIYNEKCFTFSSSCSCLNGFWEIGIASNFPDASVIL